MEPEYGREYRALYEAPLVVARSRRSDGQVLRRRASHGTNVSKSWMSDAATRLFFSRLSAFGDVEGSNPKKRWSMRRKPAPDTRFDRSPSTRISAPQEVYDLILMLRRVRASRRSCRSARCACELVTRERNPSLTVPAFRLLWTNHDVINHHRYAIVVQLFVHSSIRPASQSSKSAIGISGPARPSSPFDSSNPFSRHPPAVARVPPAWINRPLYWISRTEQRTLGAIGTPFGSSLMVYCAKNLIARTPGASTPHREFLPRLTRNTFWVPPPVSRSTE